MGKNIRKSSEKPEIIKECPFALSMVKLGHTRKVKCLGFIGQVCWNYGYLAKERIPIIVSMTCERHIEMREIDRCTTESENIKVPLHN